jgi:hypothetical protein
VWREVESVSESFAAVRQRSMLHTVHCSCRIGTRACSSFSRLLDPPHSLRTALLPPPPFPSPHFVPAHLSSQSDSKVAGEQAHFAQIGARTRAATVIQRAWLRFSIWRRIHRDLHWIGKTVNVRMKQSLAQVRLAPPVPMSGLMTADYKRQMVTMSHQGKVDIEGNAMMAPILYGPHVKVPACVTPPPYHCPRPLSRADPPLFTLSRSLSRWS